ncbi:MAG: hypothetical protein ABIQ05_06695 [Candidatus Limnocylindria bacterium]
MTDGASYITRTREILNALSPGQQPVTITVPLQADESEWFAKAVDDHVIAFQTCDPACPRLKRYGVPGPDEFVVGPRQFRHLFSAPRTDGQWLNREYIPHLAAYAMAVRKFRYEPARAALSKYRKFQRDRISKRAGVGYETDGEFYDLDGRIYLHLEVKTKPAEVEAIARQLDSAGSLMELPANTRKEIEYVLELAPLYFWLVGPGTIDPPRHVFQVTTDGHSAMFDRVPHLPAPPQPRASNA